MQAGPAVLWHVLRNHRLWRVLGPWRRRPTRSHENGRSKHQGRVSEVGPGEILRDDFACSGAGPFVDASRRDLLAMRSLPLTYLRSIGNADPATVRPRLGHRGRFGHPQLRSSASRTPSWPTRIVSRHSSPLPGPASTSRRARSSCPVALMVARYGNGA